MKRTGLILLACLLLALPTVAQTPEKAAPYDLVVTAEIVGHSYRPAASTEKKPRLILYVRLSVRNQTEHLREVVIMSCGWDNSWIQKGSHGFCGWACDKNIPRTISIQAGQSLIFYGPLCQWHESAEGMVDFALGFVDSAGCYYCIPSAKKRDKFLRDKVVYWSNELKIRFDPTTMPAVSGSNQYPSYSVSEIAK